MKILLLGSTGMAGSAIYKSLEEREISVVGVARNNSDYNCDLTDESQLSNMLNKHTCDAIINAAALVNVDYCERNPTESWKINSKLVSILANFVNKTGVSLLQISTDHFYTYGENLPHKEDDTIMCINEYSRHKYAAEAFALTSKNSLVVRTSIVGSRARGDKSLVEWAIHMLNENQSMALFHDAWTSSLDVNTFADIAVNLFLDIKYRGIINVAAGEVYSKEQLIRRLADMLSLNQGNCTSESVNRRYSNRPNCLGLDVSQAERLLGKKMPELDEVCAALISQLNLKKVVD